MLQAVRQIVIRIGAARIMKNGKNCIFLERFEPHEFRGRRPRAVVPQNNNRKLHDVLNSNNNVNPVVSTVWSYWDDQDKLRTVNHAMVALKIYKYSSDPEKD